MVGWFNAQFSYDFGVNIRYGGLVVYNCKSFDGSTRFGITEAYRARAAKRMSKEHVSLNVGETFRAKLSIDICISRRLFGRQTSKIRMV